MFDKLDALINRYDEIMNELSEPGVTDNQSRYRALMKEQSDLTPLVEAYKEYRQSKQDIEDSLAMLEEESDEDMREMLKEELSDAKKRVEQLENEMKILLLPKDPMIKTSSWKSEPVQAETKQLFLLLKSIVCMCTMQRASGGR